MSLFGLTSAKRHKKKLENSRWHTKVFINQLEYILFVFIMTELASKTDKDKETDFCRVCVPVLNANVVIDNDDCWTPNGGSINVHSVRNPITTSWHSDDLPTAISLHITLVSPSCHRLAEARLTPADPDRPPIISEIWWPRLEATLHYCRQ